ncbi:Transcription termination protein NusB [hydrothermal vent metagenome]|uniref:Transcription termination protein NusB n=1 Tax=hydrothermal vent metagenome TaxID=652676 RepID=A0A3B0S8M7_9ZZZZ
MNATPSKPGHRKAPGKHNARLAAVQALYQMEIAKRGAAGVIKEFLEIRLDEAGEVDKTLFAKLVSEVVAHQDKIDEAIRGRLSGNWRLSRVDATLRAILRCGSCELLVLKDAPAAVVLDEYVEIAHDFFDAKETGFVNATLDAIAKNPDKSLTKSDE